jgi:O-antigen ligase
VVVAILLFSLLLSFSRGAWFHFGLSCAITLALVFLTAQTRQIRLRILALSIIGLVALAGLVVLLLSFDSIGAMFKERAQLLQSYDVGNGGRFTLQELAVGSVLDSPNGLGPFGFASLNGTQQHNVYLQAFLVYGWVGGMAYVLLVLSTLFVGLRTSLARTPWQPYVITAFATFAGEAAEGFIIDTDHWRHFFLLLGMIWGLAAATHNQSQRGFSPVRQ